EFYVAKYNSIVPNGYNLCPGGQKWRRITDFSQEEESEIIKLYEDGKSTRKIGEMYSVSHKTILRVLERNNIPVRAKTHKLPDRTSKLTREVMEELYVKRNMKMKDIAELMNVNVRTVNRAKNQYNLQRI